MKIYYGYMQDPDVPRVLETLDNLGFEFRIYDTTFFLGHETIISSKKKSGMARWREKLFTILARNSRSATTFFKIPSRRVVEMGEQIEI